MDNLWKTDRSLIKDTQMIYRVCKFNYNSDCIFEKKLEALHSYCPAYSYTVACLAFDICLETLHIDRSVRLFLLIDFTNFGIVSKKTGRQLNIL